MTKSKKYIYTLSNGSLSLEKQLNTPINLLAIYYAVFRPPVVKHIFMNIMARIIMPNLNKGTSYLNLKIFSRLFTGCQQRFKFKYIILRKKTNLYMCTCMSKLFRRV